MKNQGSDLKLVDKLYLTNLSIDQVKGLVSSLGEPAYRVQQVLTWVYKRLAATWDEMTDLPLPFRRKLDNQAELHSLIPVQELVSKDGTVKILSRLQDNRTLEAALMLYAAGAGRPRTTACISTQVGCAIGCSFCATGQQGFERNLRPGEIIDQVLYLARYAREHHNNENHPDHITNIVFMGMGEPLANYDALKQATELLTSPQAFGLGSRNITVSTAGLVPQMKRLAEDMPQVGLAVSLHAPDDTMRNRLVPLNRKYPLDVLIPACHEYVRETGRRISFEYILFEGINDSPLQAQALAALLKGLICHVNIIPANRTASRVYRPSSRMAMQVFERELRLKGITCTIRQGRGLDIDAGCGQLRSKLVKTGI